MRLLLGRTFVSDSTDGRTKKVPGTVFAAFAGLSLRVLPGTSGGRGADGAQVYRELAGASQVVDHCHERHHRGVQLARNMLANASPETRRATCRQSSVHRFDETTSRIGKFRACSHERVSSTHEYKVGLRFGTGMLNRREQLRGGSYATRGRSRR
jgi:hypothetical protein